MIRIGHGYDVHKTAEGSFIIIGGVRIDAEFSLLAHSDGDVLIHALSDSILGAAGLRDIGYYFPDTSDATLNMDSAVILKKTLEMINDKNLFLCNADITIIAQKPKFSPYIDAIRNSLASIAGLNREQFNVKATTEESLGFTGRKEGIAVHAVCLLEERK